MSDIKLRCKDGKIVTLDRKFEEFSSVIKDSQEDEEFPV